MSPHSSLHLKAVGAALRRTLHGTPVEVTAVRLGPRLGLGLGIGLGLGLGLGLGPT
jgi:hypothetical protein